MGNSLSGGGSSGSSLSGGGGGSQKKTVPPDPGKALVRLAARLQHSTGVSKKAVNASVKSAFQSYTPHQIGKLATNAGLQDADVRALKEVSGRLQPLARPSGLDAAVGTGLDYLGRPGAAIQEIIAHRANFSDPKTGVAVTNALVGKSDITPIRALLQAGGQSRYESAKTEAGLPGPVQFVGNTGLAVLVDPTTYVGLGATQSAQAATRGAALKLAENAGKITAEEAAVLAKTGAITSNAAVRDIAVNIGTQGLKKTLKADPALARVARQSLSHAERHQLARAQGGFTVAGHSIPKTNFLTNPEKVAARLAKQDTKIAFSRATAGLEEAAKPTTAIVKATRVAYKDAKKAGIGITEARARVLKALDVGSSPADLASLTKGEQDLVSTIRREYSTSFARQNEVGLGRGSTVDPGEYAARYQTEETASLRPAYQAETQVGQSGPVSSKLKARNEADRFTPQSELKNVAGGPRFEPDPSLAAVRRVNEGYRDVAHVEATNTLATIKGADGGPIAIRQGDPGFETAPRSEWTAVDLPQSKFNADTGEISGAGKQQILVRKEYANEAKRVFDMFGDKATQEGIVKQAGDAIEHMTQLWKGYATVFGPLGSGFVVRNMIGNIINGFLLTGHLKTFVQDSASALNLQRKIHAAFGAGEEWSTRLTAQERRLIEEAQSTKAIGSGFFSHSADLANSDNFLRSQGFKVGPRNTRRALTQGRGSPLNPNNTVLRLSKAFNSGVEDNARLALFIRLRKQGYTQWDAAGVVNKYLFDYTDLGPLTEKYRKINPFFTWTRKNVPLQLEALVKTPGRITAQVHALEAASNLDPLDPTKVPEWAGQGGAVGVGGGQALVPDLPITSAADTLKPVADLAKGLIFKIKTGSLPPGFGATLAREGYNSAGIGGPVAGTASAVGQIAAGKSIFSGAPITPGEQIPTPSYLGGGIIPGVPKYIPKEFQVLAESIAPGLSKIRRSAPTSELDKKKQIASIASILFGQTITPVNARTRRNEQYRLGEVLAALKKWVESQGGNVPEGDYVSSSSSFGG